jgi:hypothetical protein
LEILDGLLDQAIQKEDPAQRGVSVAQEVTSSSISLQTKRNLWKKYDSKCSYKDPRTGKKCNSSYFLEIEHITPKAKGGTNNIENLKLYCRAHNQLSAIQQFGFGHMDKYINPPS